MSYHEFPATVRVAADCSIPGIYDIWARDNWVYGSLSLSNDIVITFRNPDQARALAAVALAVADAMEAKNAEISAPLDSEAWTCAGCHGQRIGHRPPDDLCPQCVTIAVTTETGSPR